jgi:hypothetical protein
VDGILSQQGGFPSKLKEIERGAKGEQARGGKRAVVANGSSGG